MKIEVNRSALTESFLLAAAAAPSRSPKEILQNVKLIATGDTLEFLATDMETGIRTTIEGVSVEREGAILLPVQRTSAMLRESSDETLWIDAEESAILLKGSRSKYKFLSVNPDEFPSVPGFDGSSFHEMTPRALSSALTRTSYAADPESSRYALGGVKIEQEGDGLVCVGTDGRRCATQEFAASSVDNHEIGSGLIIPLKGIAMMRKALQGDSDDGVVQLRSAVNDVILRCGRSTVYTRLVDGRYPSWRQVFPATDAYETVDIAVALLHNTVRQASVVTDSESRGIDVTFKSGTMTIAARTADIGDSEIEAPIAYDGETVTLTLDFRYVVDVCRVLDSEAVLTVQFKDSKSPMMLTTDDGHKCVLMPMARDR